MKKTFYLITILTVIVNFAIIAQNPDVTKVIPTRDQQFEISSVEFLNSAHTDYAPVFYKNEMLFLTARTMDSVLYKGHRLNNQPFLNIYSGKIKFDKDGKLIFSKNTKTLYWNTFSAFYDGPICFDPELKTIFLTRVAYLIDKRDDRDFENIPQLYVSKVIGDSWDEGEPFQHNMEGYITAYPSLSADGQFLYFVSNMPGGFGGTDIYVCKKEGNAWSAPQNLGEKINTSGSEVFPFMRNDGILYFSSNGHDSFGGLDVFSATVVDGKYGEVKNLGSSLNSTSDDFGITFYNDNLKGCFSSNRKGGKGSDDIYSFVASNKLATDVAPELAVKKYATIAGNLLIDENPSKPLAFAKVNLVDEKGDVVQTVVTNEFGSFVFSNLPTDENFIVKVEEGDAQLASNSKVVITNKSGKEMQSTKSGDGGSFKFSFLASDKSSFDLMKVEDSELIFDFKGDLISENNTPLSNTTINLVNEKGDVLQTTKTSATGSFQFLNLPASQNVLFALDETDPKVKEFNRILLVNSKGVVVKDFVRADGKFKFEILPADQNKLGVVYVDSPWLKVSNLKDQVNQENLIIIENIYYDYGKATILPEAAITLDKVISVLKSNPDLIIDMSTHCDSRSSAEFNLDLSERRAIAAVDHIVKGGISRNRITGKGYGKSKPLNKCADGVECSEEEHAKNRRTEFKVTSLKK